MIRASANPGYTFAGWYGESGFISDAVNYTITVEKYLSYTASWTANTVKYTVEYYKSAFTKNGYVTELYKTVEKSAKTGETLTADPIDLEGATLDTNRSICSGEVLCDGSLVLVAVLEDLWLTAEALDIK